MQLSEILSTQRILIDPTGDSSQRKDTILLRLAELLSPEVGLPPEEIRLPLEQRERLQSTGIGEGVAIPHATLEQAPKQVAALLLCPQGVEFDAIDGAPVSIFVAVVGPKRATSEHLKILAQLSRLLRSADSRKKLLESTSPEQAFAFVQEQAQAAFPS